MTIIIMILLSCTRSRPGESTHFQHGFIRVAVFQINSQTTGTQHGTHSYGRVFRFQEMPEMCIHMHKRAWALTHARTHIHQQTYAHSYIYNSSCVAREGERIFWKRAHSCCWYNEGLWERFVFNAKIDIGVSLDSHLGQGRESEAGLEETRDESSRASRAWREKCWERWKKRRRRVRTRVTDSGALWSSGHVTCSPRRYRVPFPQCDGLDKNRAFLISLNPYPYGR